MGLLSLEERRIVSRPPQLPVEDKIRIVLSVLAGEISVAEAARQVFNYIRPHEALGGHRPIEVYIDPGLHPQHSDRVS